MGVFGLLGNGFRLTAIGFDCKKELEFGLARKAVWVTEVAVSATGGVGPIPPTRLRLDLPLEMDLPWRERRSLREVTWP